MRSSSKTRSSSPLLARAGRRQGSSDTSIADPKEVLLNDAEFLLNAHEKVKEGVEEEEGKGGSKAEALVLSLSLSGDRHFLESQRLCCF